MVRGARSGSSSGMRMSSGRGFSAASASDPSFVPPPLVAGSGQFTPSPPTVAASGPSSMPPPLAAGMLESVYTFSSYNSRDKIEPAQACQFITRSIQAHFLRPIHRFNDFSMDVQELLYQMFMEKKLKRPPTFQEKSYSQHMIEKYAEEEEELQLYPEVWVAASGAPKNGHVYGFRHSLDTSRVLSSTSSLGSQATSAFTTLGAPGTSPSEMMGFIRDGIYGLESRLVHTMHTQVSDAVQAQLS
ncbi:hypothetical protein Taro_051487 [Colocasia esculenta]|uniref:Uncharacterized protein n=1 Tax=Colocasia esculenta TaxID=4460 RepID=A0A843XGX1_COLES|nr:hypothetical protein [Colocasia esculenta]